MADKTEGNPESEVATINIGNINNGAIIDQFDMALIKVLENIVDLSTVATAARSITMKLVLTPNSDRIKIVTAIQVETKLAGTEKNLGHFFVSRAEEGGLVALDADPRQMPLWKVEKPAQPAVIQFRESGK